MQILEETELPEFEMPDVNVDMGDALNQFAERFFAFLQENMLIFMLFIFLLVGLFVLCCLGVTRNKSPTHIYIDGKRVADVSANQHVKEVKESKRGK